MRKHQKAFNDRQIEILYVLAVKGRKTKTDLANEFGVKYPAIFDSMKILEEKSTVKISSKEEGRGMPKLFYEITDNGLEILSEDSRITLEMFWKIAFMIFDIKTNPSVSYSLEKFFSNYETKVLGYDLKYTPITWSIVLDTFDLYGPPNKLTPDISMMYALGINGQMSERDLIKYLNKTKNDFILHSKKFQYKTILKNLVEGKIVLKIENKRGSIKYRNSILGLLFLMNYMDKIRMRPNRPTSSEFESVIRLIFKNSKIVIPHISKSWTELRKIIPEIDVIQYFTWIANKHIPLSNPIQAGGIKELITTERIMGETNRLAIDREVKVGFQVIKEIVEKGHHTEGETSRVYNNLLFLSVLSGLHIKNQREFLKSMKGAGFSTDLAVEMAVSNIVCFEFFTYFIDGVNFRKRIAGAKTSSTENWGSVAVKKWNEFQKNNREFRLWYTAWIEQIKKFEEKNLKILQEKDFLTV